MPGDLGSLKVDHDLSRREPDLHPAAGKARRDRVVHATHPDEPVGSKMPNYHLTEDEIDDLVALLQSLE